MSKQQQVIRWFHKPPQQGVQLMIAVVDAVIDAVVETVALVSSQ